MEASPDLPLSPYRVLDLADEQGHVAGRIFGDLGADVIKIEPPGGDPARRLGPFIQDDANPEKSLSWFGHNANKRGITMDLSTADGREIFLRLVESADFVVESFAPGHMERLGLGFEALRQVNPRIVMTAITPFGQSGPHRDFKGDDMIVMATGGMMAICGDDDRAPLQAGVPLGYLLGASHAVMGSMIAHYARLRTGKGRYVDTSMQEAVANSLVVTQQFWYLDQTVRTRGALGDYGGRRSRDLYEAKDGFLATQMFWGPGPGKRMRGMATWMEDEGYECEFRTVDFNAVTGFTITQEQVDRWTEEIAGFLSRFTKAEAYEEALKRRVFLFPVSSPKDISTNAQLESRGFFSELRHPEADRAVRFPGPFCHFSESPLTIRRRAPMIGEHNVEILGEELGYSPDELRTLQEAGVI